MEKDLWPWVVVHILNAAAQRRIWKGVSETRKEGADGESNWGEQTEKPAVYFAMY